MKALNGLILQHQHQFSLFSHYHLVTGLLITSMLSLFPQNVSSFPSHQKHDQLEGKINFSGIRH